jgi:protein-disulfide isomerase
VKRPQSTFVALVLACLAPAVTAQPAEAQPVETGWKTAVPPQAGGPGPASGRPAARALRERWRPLAEQGQLRPVRYGKDHIYGSSDAATSLITYMDFACPYCRRLLPVLLQAVNRSGGGINWVYRHFPLDSAIDAPLLEALASECVAGLAGEVAFWEYSRTLMTMPRRQHPEPAVLAERAAAKHGLEWRAIEACVESDRYRETILDERQAAVSLGVAATPTTLLLRGGQALLLEGNFTIDELDAALEGMGK